MSTRSPERADVTDIRQQLSKILASVPFRQSVRQQRLLTYLVEAELNGQSHRIKGYTLAVDVFDRGEDFDPTASALVRVEVGRLRSKLIEYYAGPGRSDPWLIELPKGTYQSVFKPNGRSPQPVATSLSSQDSAVTETPDVSKPSIAVLGFTDLSPDAGQSWFAEGLADDIIVDLSKVSGLRVCSRHASRMYAGQLIALADIATALNVRYILQGSIRREADRLRVNVVLADAQRSEVVWTERYERTAENILTVQSDVSFRIASALQVTLSPVEEVRLGFLETANPQAYESYLRGLQQIWRYTESSSLTARNYFRHAIELEPDYASAHAWLVRTLLLDYTMRWNSSDQNTLQEAERIVECALSLDGLLPVAHAMKSFVNMWLMRYDEAIAAGKIAVSLDPNNDDARTFLSNALSFGKQPVEALRHAEVVLKLNPSPTAFQFWVIGIAYRNLGRFDEALAMFGRGIDFSAGYLPNHLSRIHSLVEAGRLDEGRAAAQLYRQYAGSGRINIRYPVPLKGSDAKWLLSMQAVGLQAPEPQIPE